MAETADGWDTNSRGQTLFRRFEFAGYQQTRRFLDALSSLTEEGTAHPQSINFGTTYVNITLDPTSSGQVDVRLAGLITALYVSAGH